MKNSLFKLGMFCWMAGSAFLFAILTISPVGKVVTAMPFLLKLRELAWPLFYRGTIL